MKDITYLKFCAYCKDDKGHSRVPKRGEVCKHFYKVVHERAIA